MKSIVSYQERGIGGSNMYRGNCSPRLIQDLIKQFKPASISDYMCGSNTTRDVATALGLNSFTYDLNQGYDLISDPILERNDFIFHHPPYWDIIKYSGNMYGDPDARDLSRILDYNEFIKVLNELIIKQFASLKTNGHMAILVGDIKRKGKLYSMVMDMIKPGTLVNIVIKAQHNCMSEKR